MIGPFRGKYYFLSNFSDALIPFYGIWYPTVEHAYQASKSLDYNTKLEISQIKKAAGAKYAGVHIDCRPDWYDVKIPLMIELVRIKFVITELRIKLLATGIEDIIEVNTWGDTFWGVCGSLSNGENNLGKIHMLVRKELQAYYGVVNKDIPVSF